MSNEAEDQLLLVNKPYGWTSFDVVNKVRYISRIKKVGHSGTLDPLASGLLVICTGSFTKRAMEIQELEKEYTGIMTLGASTPSYDMETEADATFPLDQIQEAQIRSLTAQFTGKIMQKAPAHSAIKINGKRAYELARKGREVIMEAREVSVYSFTIDKIELPDVSFTVRCSKGTYIRSLVHDFGKALNNGAYLSKLVRTAVGSYRLENALEIDDLKKHFGKE